MDTCQLSTALLRWGRSIEVVEQLAEGWNSTTWLVRVTSGDACGRYVAKLADTVNADAFRSGLRVAALAASHGFPSGPPLATRDGRLAVDFPLGTLALLKYVPGRSPDASSAPDIRRAGSVIARAHRALGDDTSGMAKQFTWPWAWATACLDDIPMSPEIRDTASRVLHDARDVSERAPVRIGVAHGDPALDNFRISEESPKLDGLIDWSATMEAPVLYDLASFAVMTWPDPRMLSQCLAGYQDVTPELVHELDHLNTFIRLRWMSNAIYFSARIARGIVRGAASAEENQKKLAEAYRGMTGE